MKKDIVIIGGMGPQASLELHKRIIDQAAFQDAINGQDYPFIRHVSVPVDDFISSTRSKNESVGMLNDSLGDLRLSNNSRIVIACNTAHLIKDQLDDDINSKLTSLIDVATNELVERGIRKVALLASPTTIESRLYEIPLTQADIKVVVPSKAQMKVVERLIRLVIANVPPKFLRSDLIKLIQDMSKNSEAILLGCTELSVIYGPSHDVRVVDPLSLVVHELMSEEKI